MKPVEASVAKTALRSKGFTEQPNRDHHYFFLHVGGKKTARYVKISHGAKEMSPSNIRSSAQVCKMGGPEMEKVLKCEHDAEWVRRHYASTLPPPVPPRGSLTESARSEPSNSRRRK